jgi:hypothetical protein
LSVAAPSYVFGPLGRRILSLAASPNGESIACHHVPENYDTRDYHESLFRKAGDTYVSLGDLPEPAPASSSLGGTKRRSGFVPLDNGDCLSLETDAYHVDLARYVAGENGLVQADRWEVGGAISLNGASLSLLPSGTHAVIHISDRDDKFADWGGGPEPDFPQTYLLIDVRSGETVERYSVTVAGFDVLSIATAARVGNASPPFTMPSWTGVRYLKPGDHLHAIATALPGATYDYTIYLGAKRLLTSMQVIDIATGESLLQLLDESPVTHRMRPVARFHALSADENYVLTVVAGGVFELWNVSTKARWRPELPPHKGVHSAIFLPGGRAALGTSCGGIIVVDCAAGLARDDAGW